MSKYISYDYPDTFVILLYSYSLLKGKYVVESRIFRIPFTFFPLIPHNRNTVQRYEISYKTNSQEMITECHTVRNRFTLNCMNKVCSTFRCIDKAYAKRSDN